MSSGSQSSKPSIYTIGIAGGSGAGKSTLASKLYDALGGSQNVTYMVHDSYYRDQSHKSIEERTRTNFDHPDSLETELMVQHIRDLKAGNIVQVPAYDFTTHTRLPQSKAIALAGPRPILLIEGILILCHPELVKEIDLKVFVDAAADIRLIRRMDRDCVERGRTVAQVLEQYHQTVRPMHLQYVEPSKLIADIIVHSSSDTSSSSAASASASSSATTGDNANNNDKGASKSHGSLDVACEVLKNHLMAVANLSVDNMPQQYTMEQAVQQMKQTESLLSSPPP